MTISPPLWMQGASYLAKVDRNLFYNLWDEGVMDRTAFKVTQRGAGANLSVDVAAGDCVVTGDDQSLQGNYLVKSDATVNLTGFTAPGSNSRYDLVGVQINDPDAGGAAGSSATIVRVAGTAAAVPTIPALPNSFLLLAIVGPIVPATTSITNVMIHDVWTGTGPTGVTGARLLAGDRCRPGTTRETYNTIADNGWLLETGAAVSRTTYARLFEHLGTTHGAGDGSTTFNLPDSRGRVMVGADNMGGSDAGVLSSSNALGTKMGEELHVLTQAELPNVTLSVDPASRDITIGTVNPADTYQNNGGSGVGIQLTTVGTMPGGVLKVDLPATNTTALGSGTAHNTMQPSITVNRMIRT